MIIKCKACGGDIQFRQGDTVGQCDHCGSTYTIPKVDEEQKLNRYNRANHFRRQCDFDKAIAAYERILEEDDTDAEAHWGVVLSRYGIEYVEDPATGKRIPTCHRVQVESILADADYLAALEHAPDTLSRNLYEEQAKEIAEIQKGILAISQNEKPYDVFICYKESDENGQRTRDSALAQEIYYGLTEQGYKVFFSRITLEDKLGQQYEPYIFAALNSAKVMVVVGTKPEHFNAVWVRNEWSRFLHLMKSDRKRLLIPCYRDMDPYELPEELGNLQAQDMGRIGFMQDLLRGVKKVLDMENVQTPARNIETPNKEAQQADVAVPGVANLMDRVYLFLEDEDFDSALEYINRVLDLNSKYAPAYAAKVCTTFRLRKESDLAGVPFLYEDNPDWQKAIRFADQQQKKTYEGYISKVKERIERQIRDFAYDCAIEMAVKPGMNRGKLDAELSAYKQACGKSAGNRPDGSRRSNSQQNEAAFKRAIQQNEPGDVSEQGLKTAAEMLEKIGDAEAEAAAERCWKLAEQARQKVIYQQALSILNQKKDNPSELEIAAQIFMSVSEYKDAETQAHICIDDAEKARANLYDDAVDAMKEAGNESIKWKKAINKLNSTQLDQFPDIDVLRNQAVKKYEETLAEEKETQRRADELAQIKLKAKKKMRKTIIIIAIVAITIVFLIIGLVVVPGNIQRKKLKLYQSEKLKPYQTIGNCITFGTYPQTTSGTDQTPIEWLVLDYDETNNRALLISKYGLDMMSYNTTNTNITWEKCTLRIWLNNDFLNKAFSPEEQSAILITNVDNSAKQGYKGWNTYGGNDTQDKVFLLSCQEAIKYYNIKHFMEDDGKNNGALVAPTAYAIAQGAWTSDSYGTRTAEGLLAGWWWLRSPYTKQNYAAFIGADGSLNHWDLNVSYSGLVVRPVIWIDLNSDYILSE